MKQLRFLAFFALAFVQMALGAEQSSILPKDFAGWRLQARDESSRDPAVADGANAALLKEYGFTDFESATYTRPDGRKLTIKAAQFADASGAFGAYTFYYQPEMQREEIGDQGASFNQRILFYRGNILVDVVFDRLTAMSAAELRELAGLLSRPQGTASNLPPVLAYMPRADYIKNTEKYVVGPLGLAHVDSPLSPDLVDFRAGAEVVLGQYNLAGGPAMLMIVSYPTPQIAAEHLQRIDRSHSATQPQPGVASIVDVGPFFDKRSGPLLVAAAGPISASEARSLLSKVNYDADVTWNENTFLDKKNNLGYLIWNSFLLCAILMLLAAVAGLAFGGVRIAVQRMLPGRVFDRPERVEFISLHLAEEPPGSSDSKLSSSIKAG